MTHIRELVLVACAAAMLAAGCGDELGQCIATYEHEGTSIKEDYTREECEDECAAIGGYLDCHFEAY